MRAIGLIPARFASTRFPGKPLADLGGQTMIQRVVGQARQAGLVRVVVATDDARIADHVRDFGGEVVLTRADHPSGTDRVAEAYATLGETYDVVVNIQGDEPFIQPAQIDAVVDCFRRDASAELATLIRQIDSLDQLLSPHVVKCVPDLRGRALLFSRQPLPYQRDRPVAEWRAHHAYWQHIGLYAYRPAALARITALPPSPLELAESLEQLRWLENGLPIHVAVTEQASLGIDTPEDLARAAAMLLRMNRDPGP
ncbi:MAG: 3-deoxy-manno-octulosonate cytidylyltransferase [Hymenobacteraceae bacterium]|nr:3-deoxy-manno-octulosonate cytidylyltransferase [Hymenobacteraceae bacterium]